MRRELREMMNKLQWNPNLISRYRTEIMGIAIMWIVLFHSAIPAPENTFLRLVWYGAVSFGGGLGVNIFILLSGFGLMYSHNRNACCTDVHAVKNYFSRRLKRILLPYLLVASVFFAVRCIYNKTGLLGFAEDISLVSFLLKGDRTYWYIFAILVLYCLYPVYMHLGHRYGQGRTCAAVIGAIILLEIIACKYYPAFYARFEVIILRSPLFFIGSYLGELTIESCNKPRVKHVFTAACVLAAICLAIYAVAFLKQWESLRLQRYLFIPVSIGIVIVLSGVVHKLCFLNAVWKICGKTLWEFI